MKASSTCAGSLVLRSGGVRGATVMLPRGFGGVAGGFPDVADALSASTVSRAEASLASKSLMRCAECASWLPGFGITGEAGFCCSAWLVSASKPDG